MILILLNTKIELFPLSRVNEQLLPANPQFHMTQYQQYLKHLENSNAAIASNRQSQIALMNQVNQHQQYMKHAGISNSGVTSDHYSQVFPPAPPIAPASEENDEFEETVTDVTFKEYLPLKYKFGNPHPDQLIQSLSLSAVDPPDIKYDLIIPQEAKYSYILVHF